MLGLVLPGKSVGWLRAEEEEPYTHLYCRFAGSDALRMARCIRQLGDTLQRSAEREKMAWACALPSDRTLPFSIGEVRDRVGYNDPLYFSKVFKRHFGQSPRALRNRNSPACSQFINIKFHDLD